MSDVEVSPFPEGLWSQPEVDASAIGAIADVEPVRSIRTPARLDYTYTAGISQTRFLRGMAEGKLLGERCPICTKVYVPSRVVSFCVVNVEFTGRGIDIPYASALVVPDGADLAVFGLIQEIPHDQVHMGMRVEAKWKDPADWETSFENIEWWRPNVEPDAAYESYQEHV